MRAPRSAASRPRPNSSTIPPAFKQFQAAQGELSSALSRLLVVAENYPQLKSDANFRDLQAQLEGTENRITVARNRYIKAVQEYNIDGAPVSDQPDRDDVRLQGEAAVHGREREGDLDRAEGRFRHRRHRAGSPPTGTHAGGQVSAGNSDDRHSRDRRQAAAAVVCRCAAGCALLAAGRCRGAAAQGARHRSDRHARRRAEGRARADARGVRSAQGRAGRGADGADHATRNRRAVRGARRGKLEARPQGRRRRRAAADRQGRPQAAHRSRLRARRRAARRHRQAHHFRRHRAALQAGRFLRRCQCGCRTHHQGDRRRAAAAAESAARSTTAERISNRCW